VSERADRRFMYAEEKDLVMAMWFASENKIHSTICSGKEESCTQQRQATLYICRHQTYNEINTCPPPCTHTHKSTTSSYPINKHALCLEIPHTWTAHPVQQHQTNSCVLAWQCPSGWEAGPAALYRWHLQVSRSCQDRRREIYKTVPREPCMYL